ncbi:helix-turn-helix domain-containing protein [Aquibacillus kalidii]|uniref:helix-turn-helix domain-containing protein n=1 Tax=Aquibacillus kalidii TaxID=2762597 RepID=UPI0016442654|nr:helix-turn-helix transcriptional regulator [Aquibacillus kalidii]
MIGEKIKKLRKKKGYSVTKLAALADISKSYLSYIERGIQLNPSLQVLSKIALTLNTNVEYLLDNHSLQSEEESLHVSQQQKRIDDDWENLLKTAISEGMSKEDFVQLTEFIRFKNAQETSIKKP